MYLRATGGEVGATSSLAPKIGPLGLVSDRIKKMRHLLVELNISILMEYFFFTTTIIFFFVVAGKGTIWEHKEIREIIVNSSCLITMI